MDVIAGKSPLHYWHRYLNPDREPEQPTPAKELGTAIHSIVLEPDTFDRVVAVNPGIDRRSNAGKAEYAAFIAEHAGKIILPDEGYQTCLAIRDAVYRHPLAKGLLTGGKAEQSFFALDPDENELVKCRFDYFHEGGTTAVDVKSTEDASPAGFGKSVANYRYHLQPPWYFDVLDILYGETPTAWAFLAFEKDPPYAIGVYYATEEQMQIGRELARRDLRRIAELKRAAAAVADDPEALRRVWCDYGVEALPVELPRWALPR